ncbi:hypothetical protein D9M72_513970 [compost metagenome]
MPELAGKSGAIAGPVMRGNDLRILDRLKGRNDEHERALQQVERKQGAGSTRRAERRGEDRLQCQGREHGGSGGPGRHAAIDEMLADTDIVERGGWARVGAAGKKECKQAIGNVTGEQARDGRQEAWRDECAEERTRGENGGAGALQHREGAEILAKTQHGQMQIAAALCDRDQAADKRHDRRHAEDQGHARRDQAQHGAGEGFGQDRPPLRRFTVRIRPRVETHAGETHPFEGGDRRELADGDEQ